MKCIKAKVNTNGFVKDEIIRAENELAQLLVRDKLWEYCPKHEWKAQERK